MFAKIDTQGNIIEFPIRNANIRKIRKETSQNQEVSSQADEFELVIDSVTVPKEITDSFLNEKYKDAPTQLIFGQKQQVRIITPEEMAQLIEEEKTKLLPFVVEVDTNTNIIPNLPWDKIQKFDSIEKRDGKYIVIYETADKYGSEEEKKNEIKKTVAFFKVENENDFIKLAENLKAGYNKSEVDSWDQQLQQAKDFLATGTNPGTLLSSIAESRNISVQELSEKIVANAEEYANKLGNLLGRYQSNKKLLNSINTDTVLSAENINNYKKLVL